MAATDVSVNACSATYPCPTTCTTRTSATSRYQLSLKASCCVALVGSSSRTIRSSDSRQHVSRSSGHLRLAAAGLSRSPLMFSCSCLGANSKRLRCHLQQARMFEPESARHQGLHFPRPAQAQQASSAAGGHNTGFSAKYRYAASSAVLDSDWLDQ